MLVETRERMSVKSRAVLRNNFDMPIISKFWVKEIYSYSGCLCISGTMPLGDGEVRLRCRRVTAIGLSQDCYSTTSRPRHFNVCTTSYQDEGISRLCLSPLENCSTVSPHRKLSCASVFSGWRTELHPNIFLTNSVKVTIGGILEMIQSVLA